MNELAEPQNTDGDDRVTASVDLNISGRKLHLEMTLPTAPTRPMKLLPLFQSLADSIVGIGVENAEAAGLRVSCRAGCGACCRQLVPISKTEAHRLREVVDEMPEARRAEILSRFGAAHEKLQAAGLMERLEARGFATKQEAAAFGLEYFAQGIACPFLEAESCSIYPDRPVSCREYLVTSPAENCARPSPQTVRCVPMPGHVSTSLSRLGAPSAAGRAPWVPLILALQWAAGHPDEPPARPGPEVVREVFSRLTEREIDGPES
jgi:Fe-S-cluster containining protein